MTEPTRLEPSRTVPRMRWSATSLWRPGPATLVVLAVGLWLFGTGDAMLLSAGIGNTPWTVLAEGIGERTGWSVGTITIVIGAVVLLAWFPLGERAGVGTLANIVVIGIAIDVMRPIVWDPTTFATQLLQVFAGVLTVGLGGALYLSAHLGSGPRDGWMTGVNRRFGWPISWVRFGIEATVLAAGIALGGTFGPGTVLFALLIGHSLGWSLAVLEWGQRRRPPG